MLGNNGLSGNKLIRDGLQALKERLPSGWIVRELQRKASALVDGYVELTAPDRRKASLAIEAKRRLDPRSTLSLIAELREADIPRPILVIARYLSPSVRERLQENDFGFVDLAGNARINLASPGLYIETEGANIDPNPDERPTRSLRGLKAGRIVRALVDFRAAPGVRELAARTRLNPGYVSRVLALLESEALITRSGQGQVARVDWPALLRRWAQAAPFERRGEARLFLEPRGLSLFLERLAKSSISHAVTGSLAASRIAPVAPTRLGTVYIASDVPEVAAALALRTVDAGANVLLVEANDEGVFERSTSKEGVTYAGLSQVAADLLTSPGRGPAEAEELLTWMSKNEEMWRG